jgi:hypothetical protein
MMVTKEDRKVITVLLTRYYSTFSSFIYWTSGRGYTHASLSLDEADEEFYSFNFKGFCKERPRKHKRRSGKSICYRLLISKECYETIKDRIEAMERKKGEWSYSRLGVFFCLFHIPYKRDKHYFCSQFVAEMLSLSKDIVLGKKSKGSWNSNIIHCYNRNSKYSGTKDSGETDWAASFGDFDSYVCRLEINRYRWTGMFSSNVICLCKS